MKKNYGLSLLIAFAAFVCGGGSSHAQTYSSIPNTDATISGNGNKDVVTYSNKGNTYICAMVDGRKPSLWSQAGWTNLITMYFGGWKYQSGSGHSNSEANSLLAGYYYKTTSAFGNNNDESKEDRWKKSVWDRDYCNTPATANGNFDYFQCYFPDYKYNSFGNTENARSEFLEYDNQGKYINYFHGGDYRNGNPFTVPCFGTFLKFEPEVDGDIVLYLMQNGVVDLSTSSALGAETPQLLNQAKWRPTYIVDERGYQLTDDAEDEDKRATAELPTTRNYVYGGNAYDYAASEIYNQKIYIGWDGSSMWTKEGNVGEKQTPNYTKRPVSDESGNVYYELRLSGNYNLNIPYITMDGDKVAGFMLNVQRDLTDKQWELLTGYTKDLQTRVPLPYEGEPYWEPGGADMRVMPPSHSKDGWILINKSYIKYKFHVQAGKSYYVFNNDSKIGFNGYEFTPDNSKRPTGSLTISDNDPNNPFTLPNETKHYAQVTIKRTGGFKEGWNAICLPFSVTESKMREVFGNGNKENYELVTYNGAEKVTDGGVSTDGNVIAHFFRHAYQDIIAGYPYMIYIPAGAPALTGITDRNSSSSVSKKQENGKDITSITFNNITIEKDTEMATFSSSHDYMQEGTKNRYDLAPEDYYTFEGTFNPTDIPAGSYVVYGIGSYSDTEKPATTGIRNVPNDGQTMNGLRSYLHPNKGSKSGAEVQGAVRIVGTNFSNLFDDEKWDDATVINDIMAEIGFFNQRENVYSVTGQLVRQNSTSLVGLPKGIYIVNGKKYYVK